MSLVYPWMVFTTRLHKTTSTYGWDWELMIGKLENGQKFPH
ncbi:MAG: hypothetical protein WCO29_23270 [Nostocales cyanobacterium ELA583]